MLITRIRTKEGKKLTESEVATIAEFLRLKLEKAGFVTNVQFNSSSIKLSKHSCSFTVDVAKLGYNARINHSTIDTYQTGFRRTNTPTWTQREEFNHVVNNVLDKYKLRARVKSGEYAIRHFHTGRVIDWTLPESYRFFKGYHPTLEIVPLEHADVAVANYETNAPFSFVPHKKPRFSPRKAA
jgi:hypothetical protein